MAHGISKSVRRPCNEIYLMEERATRAWVRWPPLGSAHTLPLCPGARCCAIERRTEAPYRASILTGRQLAPVCQAIGHKLRRIPTVRLHELLPYAPHEAAP